MTQVFLNRLRDFLHNNEEYFTEGLINAKSMGSVDLHLYSQIKGEILLSRRILDLDSSLDDEELNKRLDDERDSVGT